MKDLIEKLYREADRTSDGRASVSLCLAAKKIKQLKAENDYRETKMISQYLDLQEKLAEVKANGWSKGEWE